MGAIGVGGAAALGIFDSTPPTAVVGERFQTADGGLTIEVTALLCRVNNVEDDFHAGLCRFSFDAHNGTSRDLLIDESNVHAIVVGGRHVLLLNGDTTLQPGDAQEVSGWLRIVDGELTGLAFDTTDASGDSAVVVETEDEWRQARNEAATPRQLRRAVLSPTSVDRPLLPDRGGQPTGTHLLTSHPPDR